MDAFAGAGKKFLANIILSFIRTQHKTAIAMAMSEIAATLFMSGTTFHNIFEIPIPFYEDSSSKLNLRFIYVDIIKKAFFIIIDEVSMMHKNQLDLLDEFLQCVMKNTQLMGGKIVLLIHDFRQILPVIPGGRRENIVAASIKNRKIWVNVVHLALTQNMRIEKLMHDNLSHE